MPAGRLGGLGEQLQSLVNLTLQKQLRTATPLQAGVRVALDSGWSNLRWCWQQAWSDSTQEGYRRARSQSWPEQPLGPHTQYM